MSVIVSDEGFAPEHWKHGFVPLDQLAANASGPAVAVDVPSDTDAQLLADRIQDIDLIRIHFPSFSDGRGFTIARRLRLMGFQGRLRAQGHLIADQYAMARRSGFDEVEIDDAIAARQPENQWKRRADWRAHDYQSRLRA